MVTFPGKKQLSLVIRRYQETTGEMGFMFVVTTSVVALL